MKGFIHIILLIFRAAYKNNTAAIALRTLGDAGDAASFHRMVIFHSNGYRILGTYKTILRIPKLSHENLKYLSSPRLVVVCVPVDSSNLTAVESEAVATTNI